MKDLNINICQYPRLVERTIAHLEKERDDSLMKDLLGVIDKTDVRDFVKHYYSALNKRYYQSYYDGFDAFMQKFAEALYSTDGLDKDKSDSIGMAILDYWNVEIADTVTETAYV